MQVDLDLGNYERFMDITLNRDNNITTGKIYQVMHAVHPASQPGDVAELLQGESWTFA